MCVHVPKQSMKAVPAEVSSSTRTFRDGPKSAQIELACVWCEQEDLMIKKQAWYNIGRRRGSDPWRAGFEKRWMRVVN